ncbi:hypothetical protein TDB9533_01783 [Thalassocella blandensis]|nr:hypothetical protein TDB9533_01783 [Thalassocella blandensis]
MKLSRQPFYLFIAILVIGGVSLSLYRHYAFNVPWLPGEKRLVWSIEAKIEFQARSEPVKVSFAIPDTQPGFMRMAEHTASAGYGLAYLEDPEGRRAQWSIRNAEGPQTLYYRVDMMVDNSQWKTSGFSEAPALESMDDEGPYVTAAKALLDEALERSADAYTLTHELIQEFNTQTQREQYLLQDTSRIVWLVKLLQEAKVPAREVLALNLEDGRRRQHLVSYLQVFAADGSYKLFNPSTGQLRKRDRLLLWEYNSQPLLDLLGGTRSRVMFSMIEQELPINETQELEAFQESSLLDLSIHSLPLEEQTLFKGILLIPVGVLVVVFLRIFIGLRTSGTFMPVLIAMAFIQTKLMVGLVGFISILAIGLMIRSYLSKLNLLLVARISAVIITVIILIAILSVIAYQLGLTEGLKITFFPMIILSWTIERMSILWEEEGAQEVFKQSGGSLFVALIAYMLMTNELVRHLTFNFLGLQLVLMALVLMMGSYTGYRISELRRFKPLQDHASQTSGNN